MPRPTASHVVYTRPLAKIGIQNTDTQGLKTKYKEIIGIFGIAALLYIASNYSNSSLLKLFDLNKPTALIYYINRLLLWCCLLLLFFYSKSFEKQDLILWKEKKPNLLTATLSVTIILFILFAGLVVIALLLNYLDFNSRTQKTVERNIIFKNNISLLVFSAFTAGALEEIVCRGYIQPRIERMTQSPLWGILLSSLLFGLMHMSYGTMHQVLIPIFFGIVFSTFYTNYRSLTILIICHFIWDLLSTLDAIR